MRFVIRTCYGKVKVATCHFVACLSMQQHGGGAQRRFPMAGGGGGCVEFAKQSLRNKTRPAGGARWALAFFAIVFSAVWFYLAENVWGPMAQNVVGNKEFIRSRQQVKGGGVRKAARGPKTCDC